MIKFGDINIIGVFFGDIPITSAFKGEDLVYKTGGSYPKDAVVLKAVKPGLTQLRTNNTVDRIDWGDGTVDTAIPDYATHTYSDTSKEYIILIFYKPESTPNYLGFNANNSLNAITEILQYGNKDLKILGKYKGDESYSPKLTYIGSPHISNIYLYFSGNYNTLTLGDFSNCTEFRPNLQYYNEIHFEDGFSVKKDCTVSPVFHNATKLTGFANFANGIDHWSHVGDFGPYLTQIERIALPRNKELNSPYYFKGSTELAFVNITNIGQHRKADNEDYTYNFPYLENWGDDSVVAGARQSLVDSLVNNSFDVTKYPAKTTIYLTLKVANRLTDEEYEAILNKGYIVEPARPRSAKFVLDTNLAPDLNSVELPIRCIAGEDDFSYSKLAYLNMNVDWGDGTPIETFNDTARRATAAPLHTHSYAERKEYTVKVTVTKDEWYGLSSYPDPNYCAAHFYNTANSCLTKVIRWVDKISTRYLNAEFRHTRNIVEMAPLILIGGICILIVDKPFKYLLPSKGDAVAFPGYEENTTITEVEGGDFFVKWKYQGELIANTPYNNFEGLKHFKGTIDAVGTGLNFYVLNSLNSALLKIDKFYIGDTFDTINRCISNVPVHSLTIMNIGKLPMSEIKNIHTNSKGIQYIVLKYLTQWGENTSECPDAKQSLLDSFITYSTPQETPYNVVLDSEVYARFTPEEIAQINAKNIFIGTNKEDFNN